MRGFMSNLFRKILLEMLNVFILTLIDDSGKIAGNKTNDILNPENKYIGITTVRI